MSDRQLPKIVVLATGGTIVSSGASAVQVTGYSIDKVRVDDILATVLALSDIARIEAEQISNIDSGSMTSAVWLKLASRIEALASDPDVAGFVVTHGTDTMEETAFFLHLTLHTAKPVVFTGAMRPATAVSADGPFNLYNAVRAAAAPESAGKGVLIVFNDRIYSARFAAKRHPTNPDAFGGGDFGALGLIAGSHVEYLQTPVKKHTVRSDFTVPAGPLPRVDILTSHADDDGVLIRAAVEAGARGIIYAGTGNGSVHEASEPWLFDAAEKGVLIVRASRTGDGMTTEGLAKWQKAGFIPAGTLSAQKARILLQLILLESRDAKVAAELFSEY